MRNDKRSIWSQIDPAVIAVGEGWSRHLIGFGAGLRVDTAK